MEYGWKLQDGILLVPVMSTEEPIPKEIRGLLDLVCNEKKCDSAKCICYKEGLLCNSECKCKAECTNISKSVTDDEDFDSV